MLLRRTYFLRHGPSFSNAKYIAVSLRLTVLIYFSYHISVSFVDIYLLVVLNMLCWIKEKLSQLFTVCVYFQCFLVFMWIFEIWHLRISNVVSFLTLLLYRLWIIELVFTYLKFLLIKKIDSWSCVIIQGTCKTGVCLKYRFQTWSILV